MRTFLGKILCMLLFLTTISSTDGIAFERVRQEGADRLVANGVNTNVLLVPIGEATNSELVLNTCEWLENFIKNVTSCRVEVVSSLPRSTPDQVVFYFAFGSNGAEEIRKFCAFEQESDLDDQGFEIQRLDDQSVVCWSPTPLGLRYGIIEILRSLKVVRDSANVHVFCPLEHVVDAPVFPYRLFYVNFASHLQNAYNVNAVYDVELYQWDFNEWKRLVDNISALRFNYFEFWLVPTLFSKEALDGGVKQKRFAETMRQTIDYAKSRGVTVHPIVTVNTAGLSEDGKSWKFYCPNSPEEKEELLAIWEYWVDALPNLDSWGIFPGDPGGCTRNGCTKKTYVDLALEVAQLIKKHNPNARIEIGSWGEPFGGWGVPLWTGTPDLAKEAMNYFLKKLPEFPEDAFIHINRGFSPDCRPDQYGFWNAGDGDGRPFAQAASHILPTLTWDYSVTEGEDAVFPHCRVRRQLAARQAELELGCYSGGIAYTMAPRLQLLNQFCAAESWWNPHQSAEEILDRFGRLEFGTGQEKIGRLLEEFECVPGWGYEPAPFPFSSERTFNSMEQLLNALQQLDDKALCSQLPFALSSQEYKEQIQYFAKLFRDLAEASLALKRLRTILTTDGRFQSLGDAPTIAQIKEALEKTSDLKNKEEATTLLQRLLELDVAKIRHEYQTRVYGIYDVVGAHFDERSFHSIEALLNRFEVQAALAQ